MRLHHLVLVSALLLAGCSEFQFDWKRSIHDSLSNLCDTESNCSTVPTN